MRTLETKEIAQVSGGLLGLNLGAGLNLNLLGLLGVQLGVSVTDSSRNTSCNTSRGRGRC